MVEAPPSYIRDMVDARAPGLLAAFESKFCAAIAASGVRWTMNSWWRSPDANRAARGDANSSHLWAGAVDVSTSDDSALEAEARRQGLVVVRYANHTHLQALPAGEGVRLGLVAGAYALERAPHLGLVRG